MRVVQFTGLNSHCLSRPDAQGEQYSLEWDADDLTASMVRTRDGECHRKDPSLRDVSWHIFRHTYISRLVMAGEDLRTVQETAGHKDVKNDDAVCSFGLIT